MTLPLYLVRHGAINQHQNSGAARLPFPDSPLELPLPPLAQGQLTVAAAQLPEQAREFLWISTDLPRAQQSASLLAAEFSQLHAFSPNPPALPKISVIAGGGEQYFGAWCGKSWADIERESPHGYKIFWQDAWRNSPPDGESFQSCSQRIGDWFEQICVASTQIKASGVVIICHAGTIRVITAALMKLPPQSALELALNLPYWSVVRYTFDPQLWTAHIFPTECAAMV